MTNILVFSPHPDDAELVIGGMIKKLSSKYNIIIVYLTNGEYSSNDEIDLRLLECSKACKELGVKSTEFLQIEDLSVSRHSIQQQEKIIKVIRSFRPQIIFSPHFSDSNIDHIESYWLIKYCCYMAGVPQKLEIGSAYYCKYVYYYGQNILSGIGSFFCDVSDVYKHKIKAIKCYDSQFGKSSNSSYLRDVLLKKIISKDKHCGSFFGVRYAEEIFYEGKIMISNPFDIINSNL